MGRAVKVVAGSGLIAEIVAQRKSPRPHPCQACSEPIAAILAEVREALRSGELAAHQITIAALWRVLKTRGFTRTVNALKLHLSAHDAELWRLMRAGD